MTPLQVEAHHITVMAQGRGCVLGAIWPIIDALDCNALPTSLTMDPKPFKVGLRIRDREAVERWMTESEERTTDL